MNVWAAYARLITIGFVVDWQFDVVFMGGAVDWSGNDWQVSFKSLCCEVLGWIHQPCATSKDCNSSNCCKWCSLNEPQL